eukprot:CAMPEP_0114657824 /NCGR_PEP_ID=MMETSP0191-20121206/14616_1 /TAXON_ID=126664 /ORGANISM="Sorites sp." /LENGTH=269 /DNA_ID=CAMNT_0001878197 /DNA_START=63 /DNA_END=873 /DNA_ORIENTATION=-
MSGAEGKNEPNDATFSVGIQQGSQFIEIGQFSYTDTVLKVKTTYRETISDKHKIHELIFYHMGTPMDNDKTLEYYDDDVRHVMTILTTFSCSGGSTVDNDNIADDSKISDSKKGDFTNETNIGAITDSNNGDQEYNDDNKASVSPEINKAESSELTQSSQYQDNLKDFRNDDTKENIHNSNTVNDECNESRISATIGTFLTKTMETVGNVAHDNYEYYINGKTRQNPINAERELMKVDGNEMKQMAKAIEQIKGKQEQQNKIGMQLVLD